MGQWVSVLTDDLSTDPRAYVKEEGSNTRVYNPRAYSQRGTWREDTLQKPTAQPAWLEQWGRDPVSKTKWKLKTNTARLPSDLSVRVMVFHCLHPFTQTGSSTHWHRVVSHDTRYHIHPPCRPTKKKKRTTTSKTGGSHPLGILGPADKHKFGGKHANACIQ